MADDLFKSMLSGSDDDDNGLDGLLKQAGATPDAAKGAGADALGGLASMLGGGGGGDMMGMLSALTGSGGGLGGLLGGMDGNNMAQLPIIGPIIDSLAEQFGLSPAQASSLLTAAMGLVTGAMSKKGSSRAQEIDLEGLVADAPSQSEALNKVMQETGLDEEQAAAGMQKAMEMLAEAAS